MGGRAAGRRFEQAGRLAALWALSLAEQACATEDDEALRAVAAVLLNIGDPPTRVQCCAAVAERIVGQGLTLPAAVVEVALSTVAKPGGLRLKAHALGRLAEVAAVRGDTPAVSDRLVYQLVDRALLSAAHSDAELFVRLLRRHWPSMPQRRCLELSTAAVAHDFVARLALPEMHTQQELPFLIAGCANDALASADSPEQTIARVLEWFESYVAGTFLAHHGRLDDAVLRLVAAQPLNDSQQALVDGSSQAQAKFCLLPALAPRLASVAGLRYCDDLASGVLRDVLAAERQHRTEGSPMTAFTLDAAAAEFADWRRSILGVVDGTRAAFGDSGGAPLSSPLDGFRTLADLLGEPDCGRLPGLQHGTVADEEMATACRAGAVSPFSDLASRFVAGGLSATSSTAVSAFLEWGGHSVLTALLLDGLRDCPAVEHHPRYRRFTEALDHLPTAADPHRAGEPVVLNLCLYLASRGGEGEPWRLWREVPSCSLRRLLDCLGHRPHVLAEVLGGWFRMTQLRLTPAGESVSSCAEGLLAIARAAPPGPEWGEVIQRPFADDAAAGMTTATVQEVCDAITTGAARWWGTRGRTLIFSLRDTLWAFKMQRLGEDRECLNREARAMVAKSSRSESDIPWSAGVHPVGRLPADLLGGMAGLGLPLDPGHVALVYRAAAGYFDYANEVDDASRRQGTRRAAQDLFAWLRQGEVFTALTVKNHSVTGEGERRYEWMIDCCWNGAARRGLGRLDRVNAVCRYPNVRATGIADLAELDCFDTLIEPYLNSRLEPARPRLDPVANLFAEGQPLARRLFLLRFAGDYLLDLTLLVADGYQRGGRLQLSPEVFAGTAAEAGRGPAAGVLGELAEELLCLWAIGLGAYARVSSASLKTTLGAIIRFDLMALQLAYFVEPNNYVADFSPAIVVDYGAGANRSRPSDGRARQKTTAHTPAGAGRCLAEKLQRSIFGRGIAVEIDLSGCGHQWISPERHRELEQRLDPSADGAPLGFSRDGLNQDLGPHNGPWMLLELERALHVVAPLMLHWAAGRPQVATY